MLRSASVSSVLPSAWRLKRRAAIALDQEPGEVGIAVRVPAFGGDSGADLRRGRAESLAKDDVHHLLVGAIAIFQRDFLGQDLDPLDGFGRDVAKLAEARDALAVEQQHRRFAAAAPGAADLRRERVEKLVDVGRAGRADVARIERVLRRDVADDRSARARRR